MKGLHILPVILGLLAMMSLGYGAAVVNIQAPANNTAYWGSSVVNHYYNASAAGDVVNCTLYYADTLGSTLDYVNTSSAVVSYQLHIAAQDLHGDYNYAWKVGCYNDTTQTNSSAYNVYVQDTSVTRGIGAIVVDYIPLFLAVAGIMIAVGLVTVGAISIGTFIAAFTAIILLSVFLAAIQGLL